MNNDNYVELECPFCKQEHWFDYKLEHLEDCPNIGLHHKKYKAEAIIWITKQLKNFPYAFGKSLGKT